MLPPEAWGVYSREQNDEIEGAFKGAIESFKSTQTW